MLRLPLHRIRVLRNYYNHCHQLQWPLMEWEQKGFLVQQALHYNYAFRHEISDMKLDINLKSIHAYSFTYLGSGRSRLKLFQTSLFLATLSSSFWVILRHFQVRWDRKILQRILGLPRDLLPVRLVHKRDAQEISKSDAWTTSACSFSHEGAVALFRTPSRCPTSSPYLYGWTQLPYEGKSSHMVLFDNNNMVEFIHLYNQANVHGMKIVNFHTMV